ncbi:MAG: hypothetical protein HY581_09410 [Nitrospirae bacterium]|nr:hypothetical protein [Nitrospirota bacterium]
MPNEVIEKHQLAGLDERERGFNRLVELDRCEGGYRAALRYEAAVVRTEGCETAADALSELIRLLQAQGYTQLRSQLSFRGNVYLGSQEAWIEYPDPERPPEPSGGLGEWRGRLRRMFGV